MPDVLVGADSLTINDPSPIAVLALSIDKGDKGDRGNKLFSNVGHPQQLTYQHGNTYLLYDDPANELAEGDMFWRIDTARAYRLNVGVTGSLEWVELGGSTVGVLETTEIDFVGASYQTYTLDDDSDELTELTTKSIQRGYSIELLITNAASTVKSISFPGWMWVSPIPEALDTNQRFLLTLKSFGLTDAEIVANASPSVYLEAVV